MNSQGFHRLDTPPPASQFRRPWSPDDYDSVPLNPLGFPPDALTNPNQRREPSDVSVEALDLADYARTLQRRTNNQQDALNAPDSYNTLGFHAYENYPPSPPPHRPLASPDSIPSLLSPSASSYQSHASSSHTPIPIRRPFSLPPSSYNHNMLQSHPSYSSHPSTRPGHYVEDYQSDLRPQPEIDITNFPAFTRGWYAPSKQDDPFNVPRPHEPELSPFDPSFPTDSYRADKYGYITHSPPPSYPYISSHGSRSSRNAEMLPWSSDPPESGRPLDPDVKEERVRMLEREFGAKRKGKDNNSEEKTIGSVDSKGNLITEGPKKRLATRWVQVLLALLAGASSIYVALVIKPSPSPPPAGTIPAYILYVLSVITFLGCSYYFLIYVPCCGPRKAKPFTEGPAGMMVLPVQSLPGGKKNKKSKKKGGQPDSGVQVNLIVDPTMFGSQRDREHSEDEDDSEFGMPGSFVGSSAGRSSGKNSKRAPKRRSVFEGLALETKWKRARKLLKWGMFVDIVGLIIWGAEFIYILMGKRCPIGGFQGWCTGYNVATASACMLCLAFGLSVFFDIKDLHSSRASPRTRT